MMMDSPVESRDEWHAVVSACEFLRANEARPWRHNSLADTAWEGVIKDGPCQLSSFLVYGSLKPFLTVYLSEQKLIYWSFSTSSLRKRVYHYYGQLQSS